MYDARKEISGAEDGRKAESGLSMRRCAAGKMQTLRLQSVRKGLYAAASGRCMYGIRRGSLFSILYVWKRIRKYDGK